MAALWPCSLECFLTIIKIIFALFSMASSFMHRFRAETKVCLDPENEASSQQPSSFQIAGVEYVRDSEIMRPEKRKLREKRSAAHQFGEVVVATRSKKKYYYCYCCERQNLRQQLPVWNGTTNALTHLEKHKISKQGLPIDLPTTRPTRRECRRIYCRR